MSEIPIYIEFEKKALDESLPDAHKISEAESDDPGYIFKDIEFSPEYEFSFDEKSQEILASGRMTYKEKDFGYMSMQIPVSIDMVQSIIDYYRKVLGKIKTVLEATK